MILLKLSSNLCADQSYRAVDGCARRTGGLYCFIMIGIGIYQGFTASEGYPYKILDLLSGTLLI
jgi:hypothetical protein